MTMAKGRWTAGDRDGNAGPRPRGSMEDDPDYEQWSKERCVHPDHEPPMHLVIPAGKRYRHVCPGCGREWVIHSNEARLRASA